MFTALLDHLELLWWYIFRIFWIDFVNGSGFTWFCGLHLRCFDRFCCLWFRCWWNGLFGHLRGRFLSRWGWRGGSGWFCGGCCGWLRCSCGCCAWLGGGSSSWLRGSSGWLGRFDLKKKTKNVLKNIRITFRSTWTSFQTEIQVGTQSKFYVISVFTTVYKIMNDSLDLPFYKCVAIARAQGNHFYTSPSTGIHRTEVHVPHAERIYRNHEESQQSFHSNRLAQS